MKNTVEKRYSVGGNSQVQCWKWVAPHPTIDNHVIVLINDVAKVVPLKGWETRYTDINEAYKVAASKLRSEADFIEAEFLKTEQPTGTPGAAYDNLFQTIERITGAVTLQSDMDEIVKACEPLNGIAALRADLVTAQNSAARAIMDYDIILAQNAELVAMLETAENAMLCDIDGRQEAQSKILSFLNSATVSPTYRFAPEMMAMLQEAVKIEVEKYNAGKRAADIHNNTDGVGLHYEYMTAPPLPAWVEQAQAIISKIQNPA